MNIPPPIAYDLARQRQRDLIAAAERYRLSHPKRLRLRRLTPRVIGRALSSRHRGEIPRAEISMARQPE